MKTLIIVFVFFSILIPATTFSQIGAKAQTPGIHGTWTNNDFGYQMTLILNPAGKGEFDGDVITFSVLNNSLTIIKDGEKTTYNYTLQGNSMTVSGGDLDGPITFIRSGASSSKSTTPSSSSGGNDALVGVWSGYNETIEFRSNGQCVYQGQTYPYSVQGQQINIQTNQGPFIMQYALEGAQLNLIVNGQNLTYNRGAPRASSPSGAHGRTTDQSLVGKWCYVNVTSTNSGGTSADECITINADGTYEYYSERSMSANTPSFSSGTSSQSSDRGTWWVEGNRVHYNSQTQGSGSYELVKRNHPKTGDAMIVLDGTSYVTYYNRSPW